MNSLPNADKLLFIGVLGATFGVRGQVRLKAITDQPEHFQQNVRTIYLRRPSRGPSAPLQPVVEKQLLAAFQHKPGLIILTLKGITSCEAAEELRGAEVFIKEEDAAPLAAGEYFLHQLYNLRVETNEGLELGQVREVIETGANEVLVVARPGQSDALIPMIQDVIQNLDLAGGRIVVKPLVGLL